MTLQWSEYGDPVCSNYFLQMNVDKYEITLFPDGRAMVKGTSDTGIARGLYNKLLNI